MCSQPRSALARCGFLLSLLLFFPLKGFASFAPQFNPFSVYDPYYQSPHWDWKTIESDHFRINYPSELLFVALKAAEYYEETHQRLKGYLRWEPSYKVQVNLIDNQDAGNGLTTPIGRFGMILWMTPPDSWMSTAFYEDWLKMLIVHEYTHFLNMDSTHGIWADLRYVFGDLFLPNRAWPTWMLEGLAVYTETRFTKGGRGRSSYYESILRTAYDEGTLATPQLATLDMLTGTNPYFPNADIQYQFGYHLMRQLSLQPSPGLTSDKRDPVSQEEDFAGIMSDRSSYRLPLLINSNLLSVIGKDWYDLWDEWVLQTHHRMKDQFKILELHPFTPVTLLTSKGHKKSVDVSGMSLSPDDQWLAYTVASADRRQGLYLRNLTSQKRIRVTDKALGIGMAFTPDSKSLVYSRLIQQNNYALVSDLEVYSLETGSIYPLSHLLRARDPDISKDGKWITFIISEPAAHSLALAPLEKSNGELQLGKVEVIFSSPVLDHAGHPKFSASGESIYFSYHPNGKFQEDIRVIHLNTKKVETLVADGSFNRYPTVTDEGTLYFVSNKTGIDNLYQLIDSRKSPKMVTHLKDGISYPVFSHQSASLYGSFISSSGGKLGRIDQLESKVEPKLVTIAPPPASPTIEPSENANDSVTSRLIQKDYSIFPSILPRIWSPLFTADSSKGVAVGGLLGGFDAVNRHRYGLSGVYSTFYKLGDFYAVYSNRSLGPELRVVADILTNSVKSNSQGSEFQRQKDLQLSATFPFLRTYSYWEQSFTFGLQSANRFYKFWDSSSTLLYSSPLLRTYDTILGYSNAEVSPLSVTGEAGRSLFVGARYVTGTNQPLYKFIFSGKQYLRLSPHTILMPEIRGAWVTHQNTDYFTSSAAASGRSPQQIVNSFAGDNFNQFSIRGYPNRSYFSKALIIGSLDLTFPLIRIFRGWGTQLAFFNNLFGFVFGEASFFPYPNVTLPSIGGGLRLSNEILTIPLTFSLEYHKGLNQNYGGQNDLFFQVLIQTVTF